MPKGKEITIWCDESIKKGKYYSNFYGGALVNSQHHNEVLSTLKAVVKQQEIFDEIKWQKVNEFRLQNYIVLIDTFFELIKANKVKIRIMFTQNANVARGLNDTHYRNEYFLLYYQFFKHIFGLQYSNGSKDENLHVRAYFDLLPDTLAKRQQFKEYIKGLESVKIFKDSRIKLRKQDITEINSKEHLPLQFLDVILGAMAFRLNNMHKEKLPNSSKRGKRTIAKEKLYKHILSKIKELRPNFNIGISTGKNLLEDRWEHPYRHWKFQPKDFEVNPDAYK